MTRLLAPIALSLVLLFHFSPKAHGYASTGALKPSANSGHRADGHGLPNSAFMGAAGENIFTLSTPERVAQTAREIEELLQRANAFFSQQNYDAAYAELDLERPAIRTALLISVGDSGRDAVIISPNSQLRPCFLEDNMNSPSIVNSILSPATAKRGAKYFEALDLERKLETMFLTAQFLVKMQVASGRERSRLQREFVRDFVAVNSLPIHLTYPQPSGANLTVVFLPDVVVEAGVPQFFKNLFAIEEVSQAFMSKLNTVYGVRPRAGGSALLYSDFNVARSVYMTLYHKDATGRDCSLTPGINMIRN